MLRPDMRVIHLRRMVSKSLPWKLQRNILSKWCGWWQAAALAAQNNFFILVIVRNCLKAREPLTNLFAELQKGTPVRYIDGDERQSRLAILVWSEADEVAAELGKLTKSQVWVDELAYMAEKGAPIPQVREFIMSLTHLHHATMCVLGRNSPSGGLCD